MQCLLVKNRSIWSRFTDSSVPLSSLSSNVTHGILFACSSIRFCHSDCRKKSARIVFILTVFMLTVFRACLRSSHTKSFTANRCGSCFATNRCNFHSRRYAVDRNNSQFNCDASNDYLFYLHNMSIYGDLFISVNFTFNDFLVSSAREIFLSTAYFLA